jgi:hypothetical protein
MLLISGFYMAQAGAASAARETVSGSATIILADAGGAGASFNAAWSYKHSDHAKLRNTATVAATSEWIGGGVSPSALSLWQGADLVDAAKVAGKVTDIPMPGYPELLISDYYANLKDFAATTGLQYTLEVKGFFGDILGVGLDAYIKNLAIQPVIQPMTPLGVWIALTAVIGCLGLVKRKPSFAA